MMYHIFFLIISIILAVFFFLVGLIGMLMPWVPIIRTEIIRFILEDSIAIFLFGFAFCVIGIFVSVNICLSMMHQTVYHIKGGKNRIEIDESIINSYLLNYWKELFPKEEISHRTAIKKNRIHIFADFPPTPLFQQKIILQRVEQDLSELLKDAFGYQHPFYLTVSFKKLNE